LAKRSKSVYNMRMEKRYTSRIAEQCQARSRKNALLANQEYVNNIADVDRRGGQTRLRCGR
jgi:hypothetical protein